MSRIAGIDLPNNKRTEAALTYLFGVGRQNVKKILQQAEVSPDKRSQELTGDEIARLTHALETYAVEGELRKAVRDNIERLKRTGSYRGMRHAANLPSRGQRTRTNARTKRGKRMTIGAMKKEDAAKVESPEAKKA